MALREWVGLTERQMAAACAVTPRTYRAWERGQRKWSRGDFLAKVCRATNVSAAWLLSGSYFNEPVSHIPLACDALPLPKGRMRITDPNEISFLERMRELPPAAQDRLTALVKAINDQQPAHVIRSSALAFLRANGVPKRQAIPRTDRLMRGLTNIRTKEVKAAC